MTKLAAKERKEGRKERRTGGRKEERKEKKTGAQSLKVESRGPRSLPCSLALGCLPGERKMLPESPNWGLVAPREKFSTWS